MLDKICLTLVYVIENSGKRVPPITQSERKAFLGASHRMPSGILKTIELEAFKLL